MPPCRILDDEALGWFSRRLPWGSYGMLARLHQRAQPGWRQMVPPPRPLTDDIALATAGAGKHGVDHRHRAQRTGCRCASFAWSRCWLEHPRAGLLVGGFAHRPAGDAVPLRRATAMPGPMPCCSLAPPGSAAGPPISASTPSTWTYPLRRDERALRQMLQHALPLTVLVIPARPSAGAAGAPDTGRGRRGHAKRPDTGTVAARVERTLHRQLAGRRDAAGLKDRSTPRARVDLLQRTERPSSRLPKQQGFATRRVLSAHSKAGQASHQGVSTPCRCRQSAP